MKKKRYGTVGIIMYTKFQDNISNQKIGILLLKL